MNAFKDWATSPSTAVTNDKTLSFESPVLIAALEEWQRHAAGSIPARSSFTARDVRAFVGHLSIFERTGKSDYRIRLMGTRITAVIGEMQGRMLDEALPAEVARRWQLALDRVLGVARPLRIVSRVAFNNLDFLEAEILLAPLRDEAGETRMVFVVAAFRSGVTTKSELAAITG